MKFTASMAVLAFVAVQAAAVPEPEAKNTARDFCGSTGLACARRRDAAPAPEPEAKYRHWINFCGVPGQGCGKKRSAPENEVGNEVGFCGSPGEPCARVKRSANAIAEAVASAQPDPKYRHWINFCGVPGQGCGKARDLVDSVVAHANDVYGAIYEREAEAEPSADPKKYRHWINFCGVPGQGCGRRRDADAIADANEKIKREPKYRHWINFCGVPGQGCGKPRNAEAIAEAINKADPSVFKGACFAEGGECDTLLKIQKAFHAAKQTSADEKKIHDPEQKLAHCGGQNECTVMTHAHQYAKQHGPRSADEEEANCNGADGLCTLARRDLDGLEKTIDEAVATMMADQGSDE